MFSLKPEGSEIHCCVYVYACVRVSRNCMCWGWELSVGIVQPLEAASRTLGRCRKPSGSRQGWLRSIAARWGHWRTGRNWGGDCFQSGLRTEKILKNEMKMLDTSKIGATEVLLVGLWRILEAQEAEKKKTSESIRAWTGSNPGIRWNPMANGHRSSWN